MPRISHDTITVPRGEVDWRSKRAASFDIRTVTIHADGAEPDSDERSHTLVQLGMGNRGKYVLGATAAQLSSHGVENVTIVEAYPFWKVEPNEESLVNFASHTMGVIATRLTEEYELDTLHAVPESQGAVGTFEYMRQRGSLLNGRLGAVHALGLNPGDMDVNSLMGRMIKTGVQNDIEAAGVVVGLNAAMHVVGDRFSGGGQMKASVGYSAYPALAEIVGSGHETAFFSGKDDSIIRPHEVDRHREEAGLGGLRHEIGRGPHAALSTKVGAELGSQACFFVQSGLILPQETSVGSRLQLRNAPDPLG